MSNQHNHIDHLINQLTNYIHETTSILSQLQHASDNEDFSTDDQILTIQLVLQYRLSGEDALNLLLKIDHNLLYYLGIQPQHSTKANMERLAYAVGNEDLKQILHVLARLTDSLSKVFARYKSSQASFTLKHTAAPKQSILLKEALKLSAKQNQFLDMLHKLDLDIAQLLECPAAGPIFDHIAALRGPISQFHEAIIHGLSLAEELYLKLNKTPVIDYQLHAVLKKTEEVLHLMPSIYNPHPNHSIRQVNQPVTSEQLEQRASVKRLRPFFG